VGPRGPSVASSDAHSGVGGECCDFGFGIPRRRQSLQRDQAEFHAERPGVETPGVVATQQTHQVRKRLRRRHFSGRGQISQRQRPAGGNQGEQQFARAVECIDAALRFHIACG
jgi:hypothetical protein